MNADMLLMYDGQTHIYKEPPISLVVKEILLKAISHQWYLTEIL